MKLTRYRLADQAVASRTAVAAPSSGSWVRFGDEIVEYGDVVEVGHEDARRSDASPAPVAAAGSTAPERLHLVVQNGRLFQQEHPDVPVLVDKGRYLLVDLEASRAGELDKTGLPCFGVKPVEPGMVAFGSAAPAASRAPVAWVSDLVGKLSAATFRASLVELATMPTRFSTSTQYNTASNRARQQLAAMGYTAIRKIITVSNGTSQNVIADKPGTGPGVRNLVLVTAHLDSINLAGGASAPAPGADDNGSGSAGLLEMARVFKHHQGVHDLRFVLFGGEEEGLFGSLQFVASLSKATRKRIKAVVNMDMIGTLNTAAPSVLLEGASLSQAVIDGLAEAASTFTGLAVQTSLHPFNSDHVPFINAGIPAVLTIEGADDANHNIHSNRDTLEKVSDHLALEILRMNTGFVATMLGNACAEASNTSAWVRAGLAPVGVTTSSGSASGPLRPR